ncbi:hypothetical protein AMTRI_Chr01g131140 [Amborella trichopoda]
MEVILCWDARKQLFHTIVQPTVLYFFQKYFFLEEFKVNQKIQYDIMLLEAKLMPLEVQAISQFVAFAQHLKTYAIDKISKEVLHAI